VYRRVWSKRHGSTVSLPPTATRRGRPTSPRSITSGTACHYNEAVRLSRPAAAKGDPVAEVILGACYADGIGGLAKSDTEAVRLYKLSADQNNPFGQLMLGTMYEKGRGVPRNVGEATRLYRLSADQGTPQARSGFGPSFRQRTRQNFSSDGRHTGDSTAPTEWCAVRAGDDRWRHQRELCRRQRCEQRGHSRGPRPGNAAGRQALGQRLHGSEVHRIADGSTFRSRTFFIRSLKIGNTVLENVKASLAFGRGFPLLGQSLLQRFSSWSIDNDRQVLVLKVL
jgi:hypothetical protein